MLVLAIHHRQNIIDFFSEDVGGPVLRWARWVYRGSLLFMGIILLCGAPERGCSGGQPEATPTKPTHSRTGQLDDLLHLLRARRGS